jgi:hypothetical protein
MDLVDWQDALEQMQLRPASERTFATTEGDTYVGEAVAYSNSMHLIVGSIAAGFMQTVDLDHGHIEEMRLEGNRGFIDTTTVSFLDFGNIVGIMHGNQSAPRSSAIQRWMNACALCADEVALWPVIARDIWEKLRNAEAVHNIEFSFRPNPAFMPPENVSMFGFNRDMGNRYPDHKITLKVEVPKRGGGGPTARSRGHRRLQDDAVHIITELGYLIGPTGIERARALVSSFAEDGQAHDESLDFLKHHITAKKRVEMREDETRPRHAVAVQAILEAAREHEADLRAAVSG